MNKFNLKKYLSEGRLFEETTEKASDRFEDKLKEKYASELGVEKEEIKFVYDPPASDINTEIPNLNEISEKGACDSIIHVLGMLIRTIPELATQDDLVNFITAVINKDVDGIDKYTDKYSKADIDKKTGLVRVIWKGVWWLVALAIDTITLVAKAGCKGIDWPFKMALVAINTYGPGTKGFPKDKN